MENEKIDTMNTEKNEKTLPMAVVLAGGKGMRLRPLTENTPKPLLPLLGKPIILHILENLEKEGVKKALILTGYRGEKIEKAIGTHVGDLSVSYLREELSSGSAGCVKKAENLLEKRFFVVCGDAFGYRKYKAFYDFHLEKGGIASVLTARVNDPGEYGLVLKDGNGKITGFKEKPFWSQVFSDRANTGIYLLEKEAMKSIPPGVFYDFGADLFPKMLYENRPMYSFEDDGVWCDVGDFASYLACNLALNGGENVIGKNCLFGAESEVYSSLLFDGVHIGEGSRVRGAIIGENCRIGKNCVLPTGCVIGRGSVICDGVRLAGRTVLLENSTVRVGAKEGTLPDLRDLTDGDTVILREAEYPNLPDRLGAAAASVCGSEKEIGVMHDGNAPSDNAAQKLLEGIGRCGKGTDLGRGFFAMASTVTKRLGLGFCFFVYEERSGETAVRLLDANGLPPGNALLRRLRDGMKNASFEAHGETVDDKSDVTAETYERYLLSLLPCSLSGKTVGIGWGSAPEAVVGRILLLRGAAICPKGKGEWNISLSPDGRRAELSDGKTALDFFHMTALLLKRDLDRGEKTVYLPYRAPRTFFGLAAERGIAAKGYALFPEDDGCGEERVKGSEKRYFFDGAAAVLSCLALSAEEEKELSVLAAELPDFSVVEAVCDCAEEEKLPILLRSGFFPAGEGVEKEEKDGSLRVLAREKRGLHLMAEAAKDFDAETLCARAEKEVGRFRRERKEKEH